MSPRSAYAGGYDASTVHGVAATPAEVSAIGVTTETGVVTEANNPIIATSAVRTGPFLSMPRLFMLLS